MILYNITFNVELDVIDSFKDYLLQQHIPSLQFGEELLEHKLFRLLNVDESEAITLTLQYFLKDAGTYNQHLAVCDRELKKDIFQRFGEKVIYFCSVLEKI